jgi:hypothetical protein
MEGFMDPFIERIIGTMAIILIATAAAGIGVSVAVLLFIFWPA